MSNINFKLKRINRESVIVQKPTFSVNKGSSIDEENIVKIQQPVPDPIDVYKNERNKKLARHEKQMKKEQDDKKMKEIERERELKEKFARIKKSKELLREKEVNIDDMNKIRYT